MGGFFAIGALILGIGFLWQLIVTFQISVPWGIGSILLPFVSLIFLVLHWDEVKKPFFVQLAGGLLLIGGLSVATR